MLLIVDLLNMSISMPPRVSVCLCQRCQRRVFGDSSPPVLYADRCTYPLPIPLPGGPFQMPSVSQAVLHRALQVAQRGPFNTRLCCVNMRWQEESY